MIDVMCVFNPNHFGGFRSRQRTQRVYYIEYVRNNDVANSVSMHVLLNARAATHNDEQGTAKQRRRRSARKPRSGRDRP